MIRILSYSRRSAEARTLRMQLELLLNRHTHIAASPMQPRAYGLSYSNATIQRGPSRVPQTRPAGPQFRARVQPRQPAGHQLRAACHKRGAARSLFQDRTPKYCWGQKFCWEVRAPALSVSGPGSRCVGHGALCVGPRRSACRAPGLFCRALAPHHVKLTEVYSIAGTFHDD